MKLRNWLLMSSAAALMAGCVSERNSCDWAEPIRPSRADVLTDGTVEQILAHNETGAVLCGWQK